MDSGRDLSPRSAREYVSPRSLPSSTNTPRCYPRVLTYSLTHSLTHLLTSFFPSLSPSFLPRSFTHLLISNFRCCSEMIDFIRLEHIPIIMNHQMSGRHLDLVFIPRVKLDIILRNLVLRDLLVVHLECNTKLSYSLIYSLFLT